MCDDKANSHHGSGADLMQQWFRSVVRGLGVALICVCCHTSAIAADGECNTGTDGVGGRDAFSSTNCDINYRDEKLTCEGERTVWGACPPKPIPHKRTKALTFKDLSSYLWFSLPHPDPAQQLRKYDGPLYRGSPGDYRQVTSMVGSKADEKGDQRFAACIHQIEIRGNPDISLRDRARLVRLQLDNCANQYILNAALEPSRKEDTKMIVSRDRCGTPERLTAKIACQPLHIEKSGLKNEYSVTPYLESAWGRMLQHVKESDASSEASVRAGVTKYKGYMRRKRGFGPFDGILGAIFNLVNTFSELMNTFSNLGNLAQLNVQMPNLQNVMGSFTNGFNQLGNQFMNQFTQFPGQITSSFTNMQNTFSRLGSGFNFQNAFGNFTNGFGNMQNAFGNIANLPSSITQNLGGLQNTMGNLNNLGGMMQNLPQSLGSLQNMIPNISNIPGQLSNVGNIAGNFSGQFGDTLGAIRGLPGQVGGTLTSGVTSTMNTLGNIPNMVGDVAGSANVVLGFNNANPVDQITNQLNQQDSQLDAINQRIGGGGSLRSVAGNMRDASTVVQNIPNINLAAGGMIGLSANVGSMNALNQTLTTGPLGSALNPSTLGSLTQISNSMQNMYGLEAGLQQMRVQMQNGQQFGNLSMGQLDGYLNNVSSYNNLMRSLNVNQLSNTMNNMGNIRNVFNNPQNLGNFGNMANMSGMMNGMARNLQGLTNMGAYSNILSSMQSNVVGAMGINVDINFRSAAGKMNARKDADVHPRLPTGTIIVNPLPEPKNIPDIKLTQLAAFPYEEITDPTHPFSPRWHYYVNDRDGYSPWAEKYTKENDGDKKYQENSVFCAGERLEDPNTQKKEIVKVDVLEYRRKKFEAGENQLYDGIYNRIFFNQYCLKNEGPQKNPCKFKVSIYSISYEKDLKCGYCFNIAKKRTNNPPCSTNYAGKDRRIIMSPIKGVVGDLIAIITSIPGISSIFEFKVIAKDSYMEPSQSTINNIPMVSVGLYAGALAGGGIPSPLCLVAKLGCPAACSIANIYRKSSIKKLCRDLRAPYTPMNKLKMRFGLREADVQELQQEQQQSGGQQQPQMKNELPGGVGDGLQHKDHFDNRMPYPRLWDTGKSLQLTPSTQQDPRDQNGRFTAIVGVGREAIPEPDTSQQGGGGQQPVQARGVDCSQNPEACKEERCMIGGWGEDSDSAIGEIKKNDPVSSWTELKLYQTRTMRDYGVNCLGRYERLFKPGAQEDHVLALAGGTYMERSDSCEIEAGTKTEDNTQFKMLYRNFPKSWRGYLGDPGNDDKDTFPKFPDKNPSTFRGLDNVKVGDVIMLPEGTAGEESSGGGLLGGLGIGSGNSKKGLPILSYVITTNLGDNCEDKSGCFVTVLERNSGKWPDVCGNTDSWGIESERRIYKPGTMPSSIVRRIKEIDPYDNIKCQDNDLQHCELDQWDDAEVYRIRDENERGGNQNPIEQTSP